MKSDIPDKDLRDLTYTVEEIAPPADGYTTGRDERRMLSNQVEEKDEYLTGQSILGEIIIPSEQKTTSVTGQENSRISDLVSEAATDDEAQIQASPYQKS